MEHIIRWFRRPVVQPMAEKKLNDSLQILKEEIENGKKRQARMKKMIEGYEIDTDILMECIDASLGSDKPVR